MASAKKTDPDLWEKVKEEMKASDKGGNKGQWSARKAQMAVQEYKKRGGGYEDDGPDQKDTHLHEWTEEDWGTRSGGESGETGERYLPRKVRMLLTEDEYARTTRKKRDGSGQFVDQPDDVKEKVSAIRDGGPSKEILLERARDLDIDGRSSMSKDELLQAIDEATDENGRAAGSRGSLEQKSKSELQEIARDVGIEGRSGMSKDDLVDALAEMRKGDLEERTKDELMTLAAARNVDGRSGMSKSDLIEALT